MNLQMQNKNIKINVYLIVLLINIHNMNNNYYNQIMMIKIISHYYNKYLKN